MTFFMASMNYMIVFTRSELTAPIRRSSRGKGSWGKKKLKKKLRQKLSQMRRHGELPAPRHCRPECPPKSRSGPARRHYPTSTSAASLGRAYHSFQCSKQNSLLDGSPRYSVALSV